MQTCSQRGKEVNPSFLHLNTFYSYADIKHNFEFYMWTSTDFIHIIFYYRYWNWWRVNAKKYVTKLACALQTILSVQICACVVIDEIAKRFYTKKKKEKFNSTQMTKIIKLNELLFKSMLLCILNIYVQMVRALSF